jgi:hypothetical protein
MTANFDFKAMDVAKAISPMSKRSIGVFVLILQKAILEGCDASQLFSELLFQRNPEGQLDVINPPANLDIKCPAEWFADNGEEGGDEDDESE